MDLYFDDVTATYTPSNVIQYNEYYAHGSPTANSWTRASTVGNNFLANSGTELNTTTALYDLDYRHFDPVLGRMNGVDPMADKYSSLTPYNYSFNSPTMHTDASGADPDFEPNYWFEESMQRRANNNGIEINTGMIGSIKLYEQNYQQNLRTIGGWSARGSITRGSGSNWADGMDMGNDMYWMTQSVFEATHNVDLNNRDDAWAVANSVATRATGSIEYDRNNSERYRVNLANGRVSGVQRLYTPKQLQMIAMGDKYFGKWGAQLRGNPSGYGAGPLISNEGSPISLPVNLSNPAKVLQNVLNAVKYFNLFISGRLPESWQTDEMRKTGRMTMLDLFDFSTAVAAGGWSGTGFQQGEKIFNWNRGGAIEICIQQVGYKIANVGFDDKTRTIYINENPCFDCAMKRVLWIKFDADQRSLYEKAKKYINN